MTSEAQKRASRKYNEKNTTVVALRLNRKTDADIISRVWEEDNRQGYIKALIRADIKRREIK